MEALADLPRVPARTCQYTFNTDHQRATYLRGYCPVGYSQIPVGNAFMCQRGAYANDSSGPKNHWRGTLMAGSICTWEPRNPFGRMPLG